MAGIAEVKRVAGGAAAGVSEEVIKRVFDAIVSIVKTGESVIVRDFGTFKKVHTEERQGINPQDPTKKITIAAKDHLKFKASPSVDVSEQKAAARRR